MWNENNEWKRYTLSIQDSIDDCIKTIKSKPNFASLNSSHKSLKSSKIKGFGLSLCLRDTLLIHYFSAKGYQETNLWIISFVQIGHHFSKNISIFPKNIFFSVEFSNKEFFNPNVFWNNKYSTKEVDYVQNR